VNNEDELAQRTSSITWLWKPKCAYSAVIQTGL